MIRRLAAVLPALVFVLASCSSGPEQLPADVQITVDMKEYTITVTPSTIKAGAIKFGVRNVGTMEHQFDLIKTDLAPDKLPIDTGAGKAKEDGLVRQIKSIQPNKVGTTTVTLEAGHYLIICNISGHYQLQMRAELKVE